MPRQHSAALPIAYVVLRLLVILNWLLGAAILALLIVMPNREWIMSAFHIAASPEAERLIWGLRAVAVIGLVTIPINHFILTRLAAMVEAVRGGDPFVAVNARRLQQIAWCLLTLQLLGGVIWAVGEAISTPAHPVDLDTSFSVNGWLAVLLTFVLARVFAVGTAMRDDLEGTV